MTNKHKLPNDIKELLQIQGVSHDTMKLIEDYHSGMVTEAAKAGAEAAQEQAEVRQQVQPTQPSLSSIADMAAAHRII